MSCADWIAPLPAWVRIERATPVDLVNLSRLGPVEKRTLWREIRTQRPALAALLQDPTLQALRAAFEAELCIEAR